VLTKSIVNTYLSAGVNILQKEEDFVWGIFRVLQGRIPTKVDNFKKKIN